MSQGSGSGGRFYCSELSRRNGERMFGTASEIGVWVLLEYRGGWARQILPAADLPEAVKARLRNLQRAHHRTRVCFIKQAPRQRSGPAVTLLVGVADAPRPTLQRWELERYEDLLDVDFEGVFRGARRGMTANEVYLVCTHGKHDKCCARFGLPVYEAARAHAGDAVWQVSHIGGRPVRR